MMRRPAAASARPRFEAFTTWDEWRGSLAPPTGMLTFLFTDLVGSSAQWDEATDDTRIEASTYRRSKQPTVRPRVRLVHATKPAGPGRR